MNENEIKALLYSDQKSTHDRLIQNFNAQNISHIDSVKVLKKLTDETSINFYKKYNYVMIDATSLPDKILDFVKSFRKEIKLNHVVLVIIVKQRLKISGNNFLDAGADEYLSTSATDSLMIRKIESLNIIYQQKLDQIKFLPFRPTTLRVGKKLPFDILHLAHDKFRVLLKENEVMQKVHFGLFDKHNVKTLYFDSQFEQKYQNYLDECLANILEDKSIPTEDKAEMVSDFGKMVIQTAFKNKDGQSIEQIKKVSSILHTYMDMEGPKVFKQLLNIDKDDSTYRHSLNVSVIILLLVEKIVDLQKQPNHKFYSLTSPFVTIFEKGLEDQNTSVLMDAAMLHDIGHMGHDDPHANHATIGYEALKEIKNMNSLIPELVLQHEEYCDGSGHPNKLEDSNISPLAKILSFANFCERRVTSQNMIYIEFIDTIKRNKDKFQPELIKLFKLTFYK